MLQPEGCHGRHPQASTFYHESRHQEDLRYPEYGLACLLRELMINDSLHFGLPIANTFSDTHAPIPSARVAAYLC